jgi:hypothetical protein
MTQFNQSDVTLDPAIEDGPAFADRWNSLSTALVSGHSGSARPDYILSGAHWVKTVSSTLHEIYYYDGTNDILVDSINPTTNVLTKRPDLVGITGDTMTGNLNVPSINDAPFTGVDNFIRNAEFLLWRTGTTGSAPATIDNWHVDTGGSCIYTRTTNVPTGFQYSIELLAATSGTIFTNIESIIARRLVGKTITVSVFAQKSSGTFDLNLNLYRANAANNFSAKTALGSTITLAANASFSGTWTEYKATVTLSDSLVTNGVQVAITGTGTGVVRFVGARLEIGNGSGSYIFRGRALEELICSRYIMAVGNAPLEITGTRIIATGYAHTSTSARFAIPNPVAMRIVPSLVVSSAAHFQIVVPGGTTVAITSITLSSSSTILSPILTVGVASGLTQGDGLRLEAINDAAALIFDAEIV